MATVVLPAGSRSLGRVWRDIKARGQRLIRTLSTVRDRARRPVLTVGGFSCFSVAGFQVSSILGFVVTGLALLTLEWLGGHE